MSLISKKRILIVTQDMAPFLALDEYIADIVYSLPQFLLEQGAEVRVLMPRFGLINERRHHLHEVVRLSGINIIIDEDDYPLLIKVASLPSARIQVYFLYNDDFFKRRAIFTDDKDNFFDDNAERMIFFCKGVLETVRKFGWAPNVIHCHGWMTSLLPLYAKTAYKSDPIFVNSKVIYSVYNNQFEELLNPNFLQKAVIKRVEADDLQPYLDMDNNGLHKGAIHYADAIVAAQNPELDPDIALFLENYTDKPILVHQFEEEALVGYADLYERILTEEKDIKPNEDGEQTDVS